MPTVKLIILSWLQKRQSLLQPRRRVKVWLPSNLAGILPCEDVDRRVFEQFPTLILGTISTIEIGPLVTLNLGCNVCYS